MMQRWWLLLVALAAVSCEKPTKPAGISVALVAVGPDSTDLEVGITKSLLATARDANGGSLNRPVIWSSSDAAIATVTQAGLVTAVSVGRAVISATAEDRTGEAVVRVIPVVERDVQITDAQFTQGVQSLDGTIPMVLNGNAAALNVLVKCTPGCTTGQRVVYRLFDASDNLLKADSATTAVGLTADPDYLSPAVQFLVPASDLVAGRRWQVEVDPLHTVSGDPLANNIIPRAGTRELLTTTVPELKLRFVPIVLASHGAESATVGAEQLDDYIRILRSLMPVGVVTPTVGTAFTTNASFGTAPAGGGSTFWTQVLNELDLARVSDPAPDVYWVGVVRPPTGFNNTAFGGFGYIPTSGVRVDRFSRTSVLVQLGWFNDTEQSVRLVAHELGHNFGRRHAPCGNAANPDTLFPVAGGRIGRTGHNVFGWASGALTSAVPLPATTGDIMGYCVPVWSGEYTYLGVLNFRAQLFAATAEHSERTRVIVVRGTVAGDAAITLQPTFALDGWPSADDGGPYRVRGYAADGRLLFTRAFRPTELDHAPGTSNFAVAVPLSADVESSLARIVVNGSSGSVEQSSPPGDFALRTPTPPRRISGYVEADCGLNARGVLVQDATTGAVLGVSSAPTIRVPDRGGALPVVSCSDGVRTTRR